MSTAAVGAVAAADFEETKAQWAIQKQTQEAELQSKLADFADKVRQFEERKADWEREMASREQRLKGEMQMLSMKHQELQAREAALGGGSTSPQPVASSIKPVKVKTLEEARALDEGSGAVDGTFNGIPIEIEGQGIYVP